VSLIPQGDLDVIAGEISGWFANATLTKIAGPGAPDRTGDPGAGSELWAGEARGFLTRERHEEVSGGQQVPVRIDTFVVFDAHAPALEVAGPDWEATTVTIRDERTADAVELVFSVVGMEHHAYGLLDSVLLTLDEVGV
jgi:hypothetical protein